MIDKGGLPIMREERAGKGSSKTSSTTVKDLAAGRTVTGLNMTEER